MENIKEIVAKNIVSLRKSKNLTQIDLAKKIHFSDKAISRWENAEVSPDLETLEKLSKVLGVSLAYMLEPHAKIFINKSLSIFLFVSTVFISSWGSSI